ncbi:hypothetical protein Q7C36_013209 [Tachysurus vachellii]|uniref:Uncharacterized protein n=1 Tax=Tachysurus vachellii TaxID=175792 RepID=A0AA88SHW5_TACVA|nr:hypothetical protein Q7C36_013209 [Tachysurus vachellii]
MCPLRSLTESLEASGVGQHLTEGCELQVLISSSDDDSLVFPVHPIYRSSFLALATVRPQRWMCREKSIPNSTTKELPKHLPSSFLPLNMTS